ncbi:MAG TPA: transaldolase family protein [Anaerolineae bacterium]
MVQSYFHRVQRLSPSQFWINNPTRAEAELAIAAGATGCTCNPSYTQKMIDHPDERPYALGVLDEVMRDVPDDVAAVAEFQRRLVAPIATKFMPIFEATGGAKGYVSIQGDPIREDDPDVIIHEAHANRKVSPNICCKIPTTGSGLTAMETLISEGTPINATEIFAVQQGIDLGELYERLVPKAAAGPKLWYSHIAGIYDDHLRNYVAENSVNIDPDLLVQAGLACSRKLYDIVKARGYRMSFIGGGARGLHHFTELVGGEVNLTINWKGTADQLLEQDPPVIWRMFNRVPEQVIEELKAKLPDFAKGYEEDGIEADEYEEFGPVQLFRSSFIKSWQSVLDTLRDRRAQLAGL